jgi:hypothetical protein
MKTKEKTLSDKRIDRLRAQGFTGETREELNDMAFGIRFAYRACVTILSVAVFAQSVALFVVMLGIAFLGIVLPNHPFDYVYNYTLRRKWNRLKLPARSPQLKFACMIATTWLAMIIYLMANTYATAATLMAVALILVALSPATTDFCVPSAIYNALFQKKTQKV